VVVKTKSVKKISAKKAPTRVEASPKLTVPVFSLLGVKVGTVTLPEEVFGVKVNEAILSQAVRVYQANQRTGTSSTKTRAEVKGGGRKPWRQKGTGRARQGSIRSPQWRGGGIVFGPKPRDYSLDLPKMLKRVALRSALTSKKEDLVVVNEWKLSAPKTKKIATTLKKLNLSGKTLFVLPEFDENVFRASRNIPTLRVRRATDLNALEVVSADKLVFDKEAIKKLAQAGGKG
jgi:large subunit ribosomal protein L4